jgi:hypothetical protein
MSQRDGRESADLDTREDETTAIQARREAVNSERETE